MNEASKGWEIGVGPSVVVVDEGVAKNFSSSTMKNDAYAFIFDQQGLMASRKVLISPISIHQPDWIEKHCPLRLPRNR